MNVHLDPMSVALYRAHPDRAKVPVVIPRVRVKAGWRRVKGRKRITTSLDIHPVVARLFEELNDRGLSLTQACDAADIPRSTVKHWRMNTPPTITMLDAMLRSLGYKLVVAKLEGGK